MVLVEIPISFHFGFPLFIGALIVLYIFLEIYRRVSGDIVMNPYSGTHNDEERKHLLHQLNE